MKKLGKIILIFLVLVLMLFCYHVWSSDKEQTLLKPMGNRVDVAGQKMSVYTEGNGDVTLVFLSGAGTASPILDFKDLYSLLFKHYRIVVVERFGYGFSDDSTRSRELPTLLSDTRQALSQAKISGPYVLVAHSMSSLEALYWAQYYPKEVTAIIGLDFALPESYANLQVNLSLLSLGKVAKNLGFSRLVPEHVYVKNTKLTESEKELYQAIFHQKILSTAMLNETKAIKGNVALVSRLRPPQQPILLLTSNGQGTSFSKEEWRAYALDFANQLTDATVITYDAPHYFYHDKSQEVALQISQFLLEKTSQSP
ncbi:alpha/beta fold hydrolase [Streptococcus plurextorum]